MIDTNKASVGELEALIKQKKAERAKTIAEKGLKARADVEAYCQKTHGLRLADIFTASNKAPKQYENPATGETWNSRGKKPGWLKGHETDPNFLVPQDTGAEEAAESPPKVVWDRRRQNKHPAAA
jgi:DNA-binding protein H-NS